MGSSHSYLQNLSSTGLQNLQNTNLSVSGATIDQSETVNGSSFNLGETDIGNDGLITAAMCNVLVQGVAHTSTSSSASATAVTGFIASGSEASQNGQLYK